MELSNNSVASVISLPKGKGPLLPQRESEIFSSLKNCTNLSLVRVITERGSRLSGSAEESACRAIWSQGEKEPSSGFCQSNHIKVRGTFNQLRRTGFYSGSLLFHLVTIKLCRTRGRKPAFEGHGRGHGDCALFTASHLMLSETLWLGCLLLSLVWWDESQDAAMRWSQGWCVLWWDGIQSPYLQSPCSSWYIRASSPWHTGPPFCFSSQKCDSWPDSFLCEPGSFLNCNIQASPWRLLFSQLFSLKRGQARKTLGTGQGTESGQRHSIL